MVREQSRPLLRQRDRPQRVRRHPAPQRRVSGFGLDRTRAADSLGPVRWPQILSAGSANTQWGLRKYSAGATVPL